MVLFAGPFLFIFLNSFLSTTKEESETWNFILENTLPSLISNTFLLIFLCVMFTLVFGVLQATLTTLTNIRFRKLFHFSFIIPLAYPLYVISYIYVGMFEYGGDISTYFRNTYSLNLNQFIDIKSPLSIAIIFSMVLTPYSYLFFRNFLKRINKKQIWCARSLGLGPFETLLKVILPQAKSWMIAVSILISLEVLCDFGGVSIFNYETFTVAIYEAWMGLFSLNSAIKLSFIPLFLALIFFTLNQKLTIKYDKLEASKPFSLFHPNYVQTYLIVSIITFYTLFSLVLPLAVLLYWLAQTITVDFFLFTLPYLWDSLLLGTVSGLFIAFISLFYLYKDRFIGGVKSMTNFLKLGYALPGTIVAISLMGILSIFNINYFGPIAYFILVLALAIRFFAPVFDLQNNSYKMINKKIDWASTSLGASRLKTFWKVHFPILRPAIVSSFLLGFLEIIKEMPITMILRPHNVNTLSTKIYELTSEGEWEQTSLFALCLFVFGSLSLYSVIKKDESL
jgi:iron(III) transport system permease protein